MIWLVIFANAIQYFVLLLIPAHHISYHSYLLSSRAIPRYLSL